MKSLNIVSTLVLLVLFNSLSNAQQIVYDYDKDSFNNDKISAGNSVEVIIKNINPFVFNISSESSLINKNTVPPNIFSLMSGDFIAKLVGFPTSTESSPLSTTGGVPVILCIADSFIENLQDSYVDFVGIYKKYENLLFTLKNPRLTYTELSNSLSTLTLGEKELENAFTTFMIDYNTLLSNIKSSDCENNPKFELIKPLINKIISTDFQPKIISLELLKRSAEQFKKQSETINLENADSTIALAIKLNKSVVNGDELKLKLNFTPRDEIKSFENPIQPRVVNNNIKIKNHFKISFSPGFIITSGINNYKYNVLSEQVNDSVSKHSIIKENETKWNYGISALVHYTWNLQNGALGFNTGFGYLPRDNKINGLIGVTAIIGDKQEFIINGGITGSFAERLSDSLNETKEYLSAPTIKTKEKFKTGIWFGIAYRL